MPFWIFFISLYLSSLFFAASCKAALTSLLAIPYNIDKSSVSSDVNKIFLRFRHVHIIINVMLSFTRNHYNGGSSYYTLLKSRPISLQMLHLGVKFSHSSHCISCYKPPIAHICPLPPPKKENDTIHMGTMGRQLLKHEGVRLIQ